MAVWRRDVLQFPFPSYSVVFDSRLRISQLTLPVSPDVRCRLLHSQIRNDV
jgi:hypothetical protein